MRLEGVLFLVLTVLAVVRCSRPCRTNRCKKEAEYLRSSLKLTEDPCQDFYAFACGSFRTIKLMLNGPKSWGPFEIADNATAYAIKSILSSPAKRTDPGALRKTKLMYTACMDNETREERGLQPLIRVIKALGGWPLISDKWKGSVTWGHVANVMAQYGIPLFFDVSVMPHPSNMSLNLIHLDPPSLPMPVPLHWSPWLRKGEIDTLTKRSNKDEILRYLVDVAMELRNHEGATHAHRSRIKKELLDVVNLAQNLQEKFVVLMFTDSSDDTVPISSLDNNNGEVRGRDTYSVGSDLTVATRVCVCVQIEWLYFLQTVFRDSGVNVTSQHHVYIGSHTYIRYILHLFKNSDSRLLANYIVSRLVMFLAPETTERMRGFLIRLYQRLELIPDDYPSWQYCINRVHDYPNIGLGAATAHAYRKRHFHSENMRRVMQLVEDLRAATRELLDENDWVDEETKRLVIEKTDSMLVLAGFPDWVSNVSALDLHYNKLIIHRDDHFGNVKRMRSFLQASNLATLDIREDPKLQWNSSPFLVNAFYDLRRNSITLPAGIMQHPFYSGQDNEPAPPCGKNADRRKCRRNTKPLSRARKRRHTKESILLALDYGRFGSIVGHEITHGFDENGHLYGRGGEPKKQWNQRMERLFVKKALCFSKQYDRQNLFLHDTLDEDIADNGGLRKAYRAFRRAWPRAGLNATLPNLTSFTPDQLFFLGYATIWCHSGDEFSPDEHSSHRDRVMKPLSNMKEFSEAWNCTVDSPMNPRIKCVLW